MRLADAAAEVAAMVEGGGGGASASDLRALEFEAAASKEALAAAEAASDADRNLLLAHIRGLEAGAYTRPLLSST